MPNTDVIVIGAGPAGLFSAFYAGIRDLSTRIIDALPEPGGQLTALYPEKYIYDVAGFPKVRAKELVTNLVNQVSPFQPVFSLGERAETLERVENGWRVTCSSGRAYEAIAVIIAGGLGAFEPRRLVAPGVTEFEGHGLSYAVHDLESYRGKRVLILGGGDSAVDWVLMLKDVAKEVTIIHRRNSFRAHAASTNQMIAASEAGQVHVLTPYELKSMEGSTRVERVVVFNNVTKEETTLQVDEIISMVGYLTKLGPIANWGLNLEADRVIVSPAMETNLPGVFAIGDIATFPGKLKIIATAFGEAAVAANHAAVIVNPDQKVEPGHSSDSKAGPMPVAAHPAVGPASSD